MLSHWDKYFVHMSTNVCASYFFSLMRTSLALLVRQLSWRDKTPVP